MQAWEYATCMISCMTKTGFLECICWFSISHKVNWLRECMNQVFRKPMPPMCIHTCKWMSSNSLYMYSIPFTETGGISIAPRPSPNNQTPKPGFPMRPFFGIEPVLVDEEVNCVCTSLCVKQGLFVHCEGLYMYMYYNMQHLLCMWVVLCYFVFLRICIFMCPTQIHVC